MKNRVSERIHRLSVLQDTQETVKKHFDSGNIDKLQDRFLNLVQFMDADSQNTEDHLKRFSKFLKKILHQNTHEQISDWRDQIGILNIIEQRVPLSDVSSLLYEMLYHLKELNRITQKAFEKTGYFIEYLQNSEDFIAPLTEDNDEYQDMYTANATLFKKMMIEYRNQRIIIPDDLPEACPGWKTFTPNLPLCVQCPFNIPCAEPEKG